MYQARFCRCFGNPRGSSITNSSITVTIASATTTILNDLFTNGHIGKTVSVYLALLDSADRVLTTRSGFEGQTNALKYAETATSSEIVLDVANAWARINRLTVAV